MVEVLATMLSGSLPSMIDPDAGSRCFFAALNVAAFADPNVFLHNMDEVLRTLRTTPPARGYDRVLYPGLHGHEEAIERTARGIPLHHDVVDWFDKKCLELSIPALERM
jgi:LDH2 family malate/lactate/ureidoglycolate dehydrogenase